MDKRKRGRRAIKIFIWALVIIALGPSVVNLPRVWIACRVWDTPESAEPTPADAATRKVTDAIPDYAREEDKTYLTLPEWYIVYSTDEYAAFIADHSASDFPHFKAVGQYWKSYVDVCGVIRGRYPLNGGQHFTDAFIGVSFTAENMLKGAYETTIGRLTEWISSGTPTEEEIYAAQVAKEYGDFLHVTPWYFFPFKEKLQGLWSETSLWGSDPIRKWERKLVLTVEYGGKILYAGFTNLGAQATYGGADTSKIYAVTEGVTDDMLSDDLEIIENVDDKRQLIYITRFEYFSFTVPGLTERGLSFVEIAGNDELLVTLIGDDGGTYSFQYGEYLFELPILTQPGLARVAMKVSVPELHLFLRELDGGVAILEHIYEY